MKPSSNTIEHAFKQAMSPFEEFVHEEASSGILLMICAITAIVIANTPFLPLYEKVLHIEITLGGGSFSITHTLHHWINDGLMALFFFVVGLEIKREILVGELADRRQAILPIAAAIGGMVVPALVYFLFNRSGEAAAGWGIPMATDIAFAVGVLALLGKHVPRALVGFLLALAIVDDLGAVLVIAIFYTDQIHMGALIFSGGCLVLLVLSNLVGLRKPLPYVIFGTLLWLGMLKSGVHATLAGVLAALTIPANSYCDNTIFVEKMQKLVKRFSESGSPSKTIMENSEQQGVLQSMENYVHKMESPLQRMEHSLHIWVSFLIIPIFALANAGIPIEFSKLDDILIHPVTLGVSFGLIFGKTLGITGFSWVVLKAGWSNLPQDVTFSQIFGVSLLAGIGFTMSIFIGSLAFAEHSEYLLNAKIGIIFASLLAGICGFLLLKKSLRPKAT